VNQLPKSVVREIRKPRSVGAGGGRPPPATRWARRNPRPYRDHSTAWTYAANAFTVDAARASQRADRMKLPTFDRRPIHHSPIFWIGIVLSLAAIVIYLWSYDLSWRPPPFER
jgi:hypothetical protein